MDSGSRQGENEDAQRSEARSTWRPWDVKTAMQYVPSPRKSHSPPHSRPCTAPTIRRWCTSLNKDDSIPTQVHSPRLPWEDLNLYNQLWSRTTWTKPFKLSSARNHQLTCRSPRSENEGRQSNHRRATADRKCPQQSLEVHRNRDRPHRRNWRGRNRHSEAAPTARMGPTDRHQDRLWKGSWKMSLHNWHE